MAEQLNLSFGWDEEPQALVTERVDYIALGLPSNPFVEVLEGNTRQPLYKDHIAKELQDITDWINKSYGKVRKPLSLIGGIGMGKTYLLRSSEAQLKDMSEQAKILVFRISLYDYGVQNVSIGGLLWAKLREARLSGWAELPDVKHVELVPLIWELIQAPDVAVGESQSLMERHIRAIREEKDADKRLKRARLLCSWLNRGDLTAKEYRELGETHKIDWEGQLLTYLCDLFGVAERFKVCKRVYFMVDQLEDLFRPNITQMRRARLLTDLRHLIDEVIDRDAPIALMLAWSKELEKGNGKSDDIEALFSQRYPALMERMLGGTSIQLKPLHQRDREPFARTYINLLSDVNGYSVEKITEDTLPKLTARAGALASADGLGTSEPISPRRWHMYLKRATEELAEEAVKKKR